MDFTIVIVAHALDLPLLKLQARSLNRYLARDFVKEIIVVDNSIHGSIDLTQLLPQYGSLPTQIIKAADIAYVQDGITGWWSQQVHKLLIARHVATETYVILDAKNHLIDHASRETFVHSDGRFRTDCHNYHQHPLKQYLRRCCEYFAIDPETVFDNFLPTAPPFSMPTAMVRQLLVYVEQREYKAFTQAFLALKLTEFFLFGVYLRHTGHKIDEFYATDTPLNIGLWKHYDNAFMRQEIALAHRFLSVHRTVFCKMDAATQHMLASLWHQRNLFASYDDAIRFVRGCAITYGMPGRT